MAGRIGSVVTSLELEATPKKYSGLEDYCIKCGKCIKNCPVGALSFNGEKNDGLCLAMLDKVEDEHAPYYGCGKCQVAVPCESANPNQKPC
jgi:epoxyqueuosine reductase QueG